MDDYTPDMSEKLVQYLDDELTAIEKNSLEQQLAVDNTLQAEMDSLKSTLEVVKLYGLDQKVAAIHAEMIGEMRSTVKKINPIRKMVRYSIGVAASLLLLIGGYMVYNFFTLSRDKVFASNYQTYELVNVRDINTSEPPVEKAYREKNYPEVLRIHEETGNHTQKENFLCGAAALEVKDDSKAIKCFQEVLSINRKTQQFILNDEAEYYLSLVYIRNKEYDSALDLLSKIQDNPDQVYREKITRKLIRQLKMLKRR